MQRNIQVGENNTKVDFETVFMVNIFGKIVHDVFYSAFE